MRIPIMLTVALSLAGCGDSAITEAEPLPWITVLADKALAANEEVMGVVGRPMVRVETEPGLERFAADLELVPGAVDRASRAMYVRRSEPFLKIYRDRMAEVGYDKGLPPTPTSAEPLPWAAWKDEVGLLALGQPLVSKVHSGLWTLLLLEVEDDADDRRVARFDVMMEVPPYTDSRGRVKRRGHPAAFRYEVVGSWDGWQWVADDDVTATRPIAKWEN